MAFPPGFLDEIRIRVSLPDVIGRKVRLIKKGREYSGLCPFHNEKSPSFTVNDEKGFFHCLAAETRVVTWDGIFAISDLAGKVARVLTRGGVWADAKFGAYGKQQLWEVRLTRNGLKKTVLATHAHRWFVRGRSSAVITTSLRPGHRLDACLPATIPDWSVSPDGVRHGIVFGDGTLGKGKYGTVNLHGEKASDLSCWFDEQRVIPREAATGAEYFRIYGGSSFGHMKGLPPLSSPPEYLRGWLAGYLATDGHVSKDGTICLNSYKTEDLLHVRDVCTRLGIGTYGVTTQTRRGYGKEDSEIHRIHFVPETLRPEIFLRSFHKDRFVAAEKKFSRLRWVVESIFETEREEEVYCAEVPGEHAFTLEDNILTGNCFGCGAHGDVIGYVMQSQNLGFLEAVEALAGEAGLEVPRATPQERERVFKQKTLVEVMEAAAGFFQAQLDSQAGAAARAYLDQRGLDRAAIERFRLGYAPGFSGGQGLLKQFLLREFPEDMLIEAGLVKKPDDGRDSFDYFRDRVMFPILDRAGRVIAFGGRVMGDGKPKYLNSPDTPLFHKGRVLYGLSWARAGVAKGAQLVVTEGYMDVIALHRAGFEGAVAPLGTALTEEQLEELWKLTPEPTLCFDGDTAGQRAASRGLDRALPLLKAGRSLKFAVLPTGEDPDSLIGRQGNLAMQSVLDGAKPLAEVLFAQELAARPIDTPERRADLTHRLNARAFVIADEGLKREYQYFFKNKMYEQGRPQRANVRQKSVKDRNGRFKPQLPEVVSGARLTLGTQAVERRRQELLVAMVLALPDLLDDHVEEFAHMVLTAPDLDKLRREILNLHAANSGLDAAGLQHHLTNHGFVRDVERLLGQQVLAHTQFAVPADRETTRLGWLQALTLWHSHLDRAQELEAAVRRFEMEPTEASWARITALQEQAEIELTEQAEFDGATAGWVSSGRH